MPAVPAFADGITVMVWVTVTVAGDKVGQFRVGGL